MPKRVRPYGSAEDAEFAALGRGRPRAADEDVSELGSTMTMPDIAGQAAEAIRALRDLASGGTGFASLDDAREVIASLERVGQAEFVAWAEFKAATRSRTSSRGGARRK